MMRAVGNAASIQALVLIGALVAASSCGRVKADRGEVEDILAGLSPQDLEDLLLEVDYMDPDYGTESGDNIKYLRSEPRSYVGDDLDLKRGVVEPTKQDQALPPAKNAAAMLPAYCDPPNPCPLGYTAADGCIESFENSSDFSRRYQATQNCICDTEHMFNCLNTDSRLQQSSPEESMIASIAETLANPYFAGEKLSIAAKKGLGY